MNPNKVQAYTDGSVFYKYGEVIHCPWGFIIVKDNEEVYRQKGILKGDVIKIRNIGSELKAVMEAVRWCRDNGYITQIIHDLQGSSEWVTDFFDSSKKPWKCKNIYTQKYRDFIKENRIHISGFTWTKGHSDNYWNNQVDQYIQYVEL